MSFSFQWTAKVACTVQSLLKLPLGSSSGIEQVSSQTRKARRMDRFRQLWACRRHVQSSKENIRRPGVTLSGGLRWRLLRTTNCPPSCLGTPTDGLRKRWEVERPDAHSRHGTFHGRGAACLMYSPEPGWWIRRGFICLLSSAAGLPSKRSCSDVAFDLQLSRWKIASEPRRLTNSATDSLRVLVVRPAWRQRCQASSRRAVHWEPRPAHA